MNMPVAMASASQVVPRPAAALLAECRSKVPPRASRAAPHLVAGPPVGCRTLSRLLQPPQLSLRLRPLLGHRAQHPPSPRGGLRPQLGLCLTARQAGRLAARRGRRLLVAVAHLLYSSVRLRVEHRSLGRLPVFLA